jgi:membrane protein
MRETTGAPARAHAAPGSDAQSPKQVPRRGWIQIVKRAWAESKDDHVPLLSAGVAFYAFLALFPALIALLTVYGLVADPATVTSQVNSLLSGLPEQSRQVISDQLTMIVQGGSRALTWTLVIALLAALWSASGGIMGLIKAVNIAYDEEETRGFLKLRALALLLTLGAIVFVVLSIGLIAVLPPILQAIGLGTVGQVAVGIARWVGLVMLVVVGLAIVYRVAPARDAPKLRWVSVGAVVATVLWILGSVAFTLYVQLFGSFNKTYGALAGIVILLLWLFLTSFMVLLGAEINSEAEHQTRQDSTVGPARPLGERDAVKADAPPPEPS